MIRYLLTLAIYIAFYLLSLLIAPLLPAFAHMRDGPINNGNGTGIGPRLPNWLYWFDTSYDNSLWGDGGWREQHCPNYWGVYLGMILWLWRNPACGFCWSVLAHTIAADETFSYTDSGNGLDVDKGKGKFGWYLIKSSRGAFSLRWCREWHGLIRSFEAGWLLDVYINDPEATAQHPKATFQFQPQIKKAQ